MKLIKLSNTHYIIIDDSVITDVRPFKGRFHYEKGVAINQFPTYLTDLSECKIITHSTEPIDGDGTGACFIDIKQLNLSEVQELIYGYSIENIINTTNTPNKLDQYSYEKGIEYGFNKSLELNKNQEVIQLLTNITEWSSFKDHPIGKQAQRALDLLLPKTEWDVEFDEQDKLKLI